MIVIKEDIKAFRIFMFIYWSMILSVAGMYTMYIGNLGFSKEEISIAVTIYTLSGLIGQSFIGYLVDKLKRIKIVMLISIAMGIIVGIGFKFAKVDWQIYTLLFIWGFFISATNFLADAWCIGALKAHGEQRSFGRVRGFGSIGYGLSGALLGFMLQSFGWKIYYWYIIISVLIVLLVIFMMKDNTLGDSKKLAENESKAEEKISVKEALSEIIKIRPLLVMIAIIFTYTFVMRGIYSYLGVLVSDFGGGPLSLGFTYFFDATPEIVTFFLAARLLRKYNGKSLILAAFVLQIIRLTVILVFCNAIAVISMGILSGFAFGLVAASYKTYIFDLAPAKYKASCMSLSETIIGLSGIISAPVFGFVFTKFGTRQAIGFGLIINVISALMLLRTIRLKKN